MGSFLSPHKTACAQWNEIVHYVSFFILIFIIASAVINRNRKWLTTLSVFLLGMLAPTAISVFYNEEQMGHLLFNSATSELRLFSNNQTLCDSKYVGHDLPIVDGIFVGRDEEVTKVINMMNMVHIVGIHGPPGFGKSLLAIHVGYEMIKSGAIVRYIDALDKFSHLRSVDSMSVNLDSSYMYDQDRQQTGSTGRQLQKHGGHALSHLFPADMEFFDESDTLIRQLLIWSKTIHCRTVLILDNCNELLNNERTKETLIQLIRRMIENSCGNLFIIVTSRQKLILLDDFDSIVVKELSSNASIQLLSHLAPNVTEEDAKLVFSVIEGCPLALKVIGKVLHYHQDRVTSLLKDELQNHPLKVLDKATSQKERFRVVMNSVFDHLSTSKLRDCGYCVSLIPGSFDYQAGSHVIIPHSVECIQELSEQSLLEEYHLANQSRYKMHRLIREYFKEMDNSSHYFKQIILHFEDRYCEYFTQYLLNFATKLRQQSLSEYDQFAFLSEIHNINHFLQLLLSRTNHLSARELEVLAFAMSQDLVSTSTIIRTQLLYILLGKVNDICDMLSPEKCGEIFSMIIQRLYQQCKCRTIKEYFKQIADMWIPCMDIFQCHTVSEIHQHDEILSQLPKHEKAFVSRLHRLYCGKGYRVYHYLFPHETGAIFVCSWYYMSLYWILAEGVKDRLSDAADVLFPLVHFIYYTGIERNDELMVWMTVYFPGLIQILVKIMIFSKSVLLRIVCGNSFDRLVQKKYCCTFIAMSVFLSYLEIFVFWNLVPYCY